MTGGNNGLLSSTELLTDNAPAWRYAGALPTPRSGLVGANVDNRILMTGICPILILNNRQRSTNVATETAAPVANAANAAPAALHCVVREMLSHL